MKKFELSFTEVRMPNDVANKIVRDALSAHLSGFFKKPVEVTSYKTVYDDHHLLTIKPA